MNFLTSIQKYNKKCSAKDNISMGEYDVLWDSIPTKLMLNPIRYMNHKQEEHIILNVILLAHNYHITEPTAPISR